jgi:hypothetical protein
MFPVDAGPNMDTLLLQDETRFAAFRTLRSGRSIPDSLLNIIIIPPVNNDQ